jgi:cephalosporin hydroxylase
VDLARHFEKRRPVQCIAAIKYLLGEFNKLSPKVYMEIGCAHLATFQIFEELLPSEENGGLAIGIDANPNIGLVHIPFSWDEYRSGKNRAASCNLLLLEGFSDDPHNIEAVKVRLGDKKIDFLFIDGDHSYKCVKADYDNYSPLVRKGGIIAFHDTEPHSGPSKLIGELRAKGLDVIDVKNVTMATSLLFK